MGFDLGDLLPSLEDVLPIIATMTGHPELAPLIQKLTDIAEDEIARRRSDSNMTRTEVLADATATYAAAKEANEALKKLGHENEQP